MAQRRTWMFVVAVPVVFVGLFALLVIGGLWALRPSKADPALLGRRAASGTSTAPARSLAVRTGGEDGRTGCGATVVVHDEAGAPLLDVALSLADKEDGAPVEAEVEGPDEAGVFALSGLPCVALEVRAEVPGHVVIPTTVPLQYDLAMPTFKLLAMAGIEVEGRVVDEAGDPIENAHVKGVLGEANTDADGRFRFSEHQGVHRLLVSAEAFGFETRSSLVDVEGAEAGDVFTVELTLPSARHVKVFCAGLPDDRCQDMLVSCTDPYSPFTNRDQCEIHEQLDATICVCPEGEAAVRGAGRAVLVEPGDTEAWLDFRDSGRIEGDLVRGSEPIVTCHITALRIPVAFEDLPRGGVAAVRTLPDGDGHFVLEGLVPGDWQVEVECLNLDGPGELTRSTPPLAVKARTTTDAGALDMDGGGGIEGILVDGLTGAPEPHSPVAGLRAAGPGARRSPALVTTDGDGRFVMEGLPTGAWSLAHPLSPHLATEVTVEEGVITDGVVVETADATALVENGFSVSNEGGTLVVAGVEEGGPAWDAGLVEGDEVSGVLIGGVDLAAMVGASGGDLTRLVLGHWDGPGVTLVVEREDGTHEVPLDW